MPIIKFCVYLFAIVICAVLTKASWIFLSFEIEAGTVIFLNIPSWYIQIILPIGFALIGFRFLLKIMDQFFNRVTEQTVEGENR